jgi:hypothetical protein
MILLGNCRGRNYTVIYRRDDAFYDLGTKGRDATLANDLVLGEKCVVACYKDLTKEGRKTVVFRWFAFSQVVILRDDDGDLNRVFCGGLLREEEMAKIKATENLPYAHFFNCNGHFKRQSVIRV